MAKEQILLKVAGGDLELETAVRLLAEFDRLAEKQIEQILCKLASGELEVDAAAKLLAELPPF
jgi:hypothetical protein